MQDLAEPLRRSEHCATSRCCQRPPVKDSQPSAELRNLIKVCFELSFQQWFLQRRPVQEGWQSLLALRYSSTSTTQTSSNFIPPSPITTFDTTSLRSFGRDSLHYALDECSRDGPHQCCQALDYCHSQGIMHRDVKPHNAARLQFDCVPPSFLC